MPGVTLSDVVFLNSKTVTGYGCKCRETGESGGVRAPPNCSTDYVFRSWLLSAKTRFLKQDCRQERNIRRDRECGGPPDTPGLHVEMGWWQSEPGKRSTRITWPRGSSCCMEGGCVYWCSIVGVYIVSRVPLWLFSVGAKYAHTFTRPHNTLAPSKCLEPAARWDRVFSPSRQTVPLTSSPLSPPVCTPWPCHTPTLQANVSVFRGREILQSWALLRPRDPPTQITLYTSS